MEILCSNKVTMPNQLRLLIFRFSETTKPLLVQRPVRSVLRLYDLFRLVYLYFEVQKDQKAISIKKYMGLKSLNVTIVNEPNLKCTGMYLTICDFQDHIVKLDCHFISIPYFFC